VSSVRGTSASETPRHPAATGAACISKDGTKLATIVDTIIGGCPSLGLYVFPLPITNGLNTPLPLNDVGDLYGGAWVSFNEAGDRVYYLGQGGIRSAKLDGTDSRLERAGNFSLGEAGDNRVIAHDTTVYEADVNGNLLRFSLLGDGGPQTLRTDVGPFDWAP
jgi:hypothetical protein